MQSTSKFDTRCSNKTSIYKEFSNMIRFQLIVCLICFYFPLSAEIKAQEASNELFLQLKLIQKGTSTAVEIAFKPYSMREDGSLSNMHLLYSVQNPNDSVVQFTDTVQLSQQVTQQVNELFYYTLALPKSDQPLQVHINLVDTVENLKASRSFNYLPNTPKVNFGIKNLSNPQHTLFTMVGDSLVFTSSQDTTLYLVRFTHDFNPAPPPMAVDYANPQKELKIDSVLTVKTNVPVSLAQEALYLAQEDTTGATGIGIKVVGKDYPKYKKLEKLIKSMVYISTGSEMNSMLKAKKMKSVFENFWVNLAGSQENAAKLIRIYFRRVGYANKNFTTYKEGWKTDRGIIYVIFGKPERIENTPEGENWMYRDNGQEVVFSFKKMENLFSGNHYELARNNNLKKSWYNAVESWRKGLIKSEERN
ncbi:GWxTD domain-containing protein [Rapidithrix thailandica]|uniref:GWxTD domain-containing protein n=1 Tax=Rapidithrix thailandica TaxID=413964 RepID=A0AAW9RTR3_9BACT